MQYKKFKTVALALALSVLVTLSGCDSKGGIPYSEIQPPVQPPVTPPAINTPPVITLNGSNPMDVAIGGTYNEPGATAVDAQDGNVPVTNSGTVDTTTPGPNIITYSAQDSEGLSSTETRTVNVVLPVGVKKTGQTTVYETNDDGSYQKGIEPLYGRDDTTEIVTDYMTQLMWQDDADVSDDTNKMTYTVAMNYCNNLSLGGFTDWRLPTIEELLNIVDKGSYDPAMDITTFKNINTTGYFYWSSTETALRSNQAWTVYFEAGTDHYRNLTGTYNVRCVRP